MCKYEIYLELDKIKNKLYEWNNLGNSVNVYMKIEHHIEALNEIEMMLLKDYKETKRKCNHKKHEYKGSK